MTIAFPFERAAARPCGNRSRKISSTLNMNLVYRFQLRQTQCTSQARREPRRDCHSTGKLRERGMTVGIADVVRSFPRSASFLENLSET
jgi:hypothetical protein